MAYIIDNLNSAIISQEAKVLSGMSPTVSSTEAYIFADLNARDSFVSDSTEILLFDTKVVVQSVWRLITTEEGEVPNFRGYGLNVKQFSQYPLTTETINDIYEYVKGKITTYEGRADVISAEVTTDMANGLIYMAFILRMKSSGETVKLPTWSVQVGAAI